MKREIPILFSTPMVQAILAGRKTQTRRVVKDFMLQENEDPEIEEFLKVTVLKSPYGTFGDLLWVRETTKVGTWNHEDHKVAFDYKASPELVKTPWCNYEDIQKFEDLAEKLYDQLDTLGFLPLVNEKTETFNYKWEAGKSPFYWTPSIFMPKEATRIWLENTNVKIERLKDITEQDAIAEGVEPVEGGFKNYLQKPRMLQGLKNWPTAKQSFMSLWESINGVGSSDLNPWVWVISYKRIEK